MLIVCPTCTTTYQLAPAAIGASGRSVRCANCKNTWFAEPETTRLETRALVAEPVRPPAPVAPPPPAEDDFDMNIGGFSVDGVLPADDAAADADSGAFTVSDAPPLVPQDPAETDTATASRFDPGLPDNIETLAARRARHSSTERKAPRSTLQRLLSLPMLIVVLLAVLLGALNWRVSVVRQFPQTASLFASLGLPVNLRGLFFQDVKTSNEFQDGVMVLVVEGTIVNLTRNTLEVPRLRFALRNTMGHEVYAWTALPPRTLLGSGDGLPFRTRLASPPADGRDVIVRFFNRRDAGPAVQ